MASDNYKYWGFISYSHGDEKFAARLHRALEHYSLPANVRRAQQLPKRLIPIFRDVDELEAAAGLSAKLQGALDESRWLIVLCSPRSAKSRYVNQEIDYFIGKHGADRVLCVLVDGNPPDCFPPAVRALQDEPLAADCRGGSDIDAAKLKLVAAMAVVGFTELRNREAQRRRRQQLAIAGALGAALVGTATYWDLFLREHVDYYAGYARRHAVWEGLDRIPERIAHARSASYRFTRHGRLNPPERVDYVNGSGSCARDGMEDILGHHAFFDPRMPAFRYCAATFEYSRDGRLEREALLNGVGKAKQTLTYTSDALAQFTEDGFAAGSDVTGVNYVKFDRDRSGFDTTVRFFLARDVPRANERHEYGFAFARDAAGRVVARETLDDQGKRTGDVTRFLYSPAGDLTELRYEDASGHLRIGSEGYAAERFELDGAGNVTRDTRLSAELQPSTAADHVATMQMSYDAKGNLRDLCYSDERGEPVAVASNNGECERYRYDEHGWLIWAGYFDHLGQPISTTPDVAAEYRHDDRGNVIEGRSLDAKGQLVEDAYGFAVMKIRLDERGNPLSEYYYDRNGKPSRSIFGSEIRHAFDSRDRWMELTFFDGEGKPFLRPAVGFASVRYKRDERGNIIERAYLGADLKPRIADWFGRAFAIEVHDDFGNLVEERSLGTERQLIRDVKGVAIYRREYDALGRRVRETYFDERDQPTKHKEGYFGFRAEFDHRGRESQRIYLDARGEPMPVARLGGAGVRYQYDANGEVVLATYLDTQGEPVASGAVQSVEYVRDRYGNEIARRYYGPGSILAGSPSSGCAIETRELDNLSNPAREQCLDASEHLRNRQDEGWAQKITSWDHGRKLKEEYLDASGKPVKPKV